MSNNSGSIESPLSLFLLSLFSLFIGGLITWYFFAVDIPGLQKGQPDLYSAETASQAAEVGLEETTNGDNEQSQTTSQVEGSIERSRRNAIVMAAEGVGPSVVSINVLQTQVVRSGNPLFFDDFWNDFFFPRNFKREIQSLGSGFIISSEGYIVTNEHVVRGAEEITVILEDGREFMATTIGTDRLSDLAVLKINAENLPVSSLGTSQKLMIGEWAIAIGNPFGYLLDDTQPTVTVGVVSAVKRDIKVASEEGSIFANMIQTDASINPGNSGGPLVNSRGEVIGVNTFIFTKSGGSLGMGFAIPIDRAKRVYNDIIQHNKVLRPWVGIHPQDLTLSLRKGLNIENGNSNVGIIVADVDEGSPASQAGISRGDVITTINNEPIRSAHDWDGILLDILVEDGISLEVYRDGTFSDVQFATVPLPTDTVDKIAVDFGIVIADVTSAVKSQLGLRSGSGALILEVKDPRLSSDSGLEPYDVILKVNNLDIDSAERAKEILENLSKRRNSIVLERNGRLIYRSLLIG